MTRILIVDDDRQIITVLKQTLERAGYQIEVAASAEEGVRLFYEHPADLVITDILMPEMGGLEFIEMLMGKNPGLPIIAMSAGGPGEKAQLALELAQSCGAGRILAKPFSRQEMLAMVKEILASAVG